MENLLTPDELDAFLKREFPQVADAFSVISSEGDKTVVAMSIGDIHLRPGGTVSGPTLFMLADVAFYLGLLSIIGPVALAVTTNATINFMRKPDPSGLVAVSTIMKRGRNLAVGDVKIYSESDPEQSAAVAHATMTYAIPPSRPPSK